MRRASVINRSHHLFDAPSLKLPRWPNPHPLCKKNALRRALPRTQPFFVSSSLCLLLELNWADHNDSRVPTTSHELGKMTASSMTVAQLKKELGDRGLDTTGLKAALVARYEEALSAGGGDAEMDAAAPAAPAAAPPAAKDDDVVSLDAGDELGDAPSGDDEPSSKKTKVVTASGGTESQPAGGPSKRELEKQRKASGACLFCGAMDHKGNECPERIAKMFCHICGNKGHRHADCPDRKVDAAANACLLCGDEKHVVFNCPDKKVDPDRPERAPRDPKDASKGVTCSICRKQGHVRKDCPDKKDDTGREERPLREQWCFVCGTMATHKRFDCPSAHKTADKTSCFVCGSTEHRAFACPDKKIDPDAKCGICQKPGHERRDCPDKPAEDVSKMFCFVCGETGHKRLECPSRVPEADVPANGCIICGVAEHNMHKCPKKKVDPNAPPRQEKRKRDDDRGRGGGGSRGFDRGRLDNRGGGGGYGNRGGYGGRFDDHDHRRSRADSRDRYGSSGGYGRRDDYRRDDYRRDEPPRYRRDDSRDRYGGGGGGGPRYDSRNYAGSGEGAEQLCRDFQRGSCTRPGCRFKHAGGGGVRGASPEKRRSPPR